MRWRNRQYDRHLRPVSHVEAPVVSIGNLTLGGTGKTPLVAWIARWFRDRQIRVAIVSRGYGAPADGRNDEALELEQRLPDVPHMQHADRVLAAQTVVAEFASQVVLLDDGFQHRRLARDLDLVLLDARDPFGLEHVFPRGLLREPLAGIARANVVLLSRADMCSAEVRATLRRRVAGLAPDAVWGEVIHAPRHWLSADDATAELDTLRGQRVAAFCGLGNPAGFWHTLASVGCEVVAMRTFPDHYRFTRADVADLAAWGDALDVAAVVCTHKDFVKLRLARLGSRPLWALVVGIEFLAGEADVVAELEALLPFVPAGEIEDLPDDVV